MTRKVLLPLILLILFALTGAYASDRGPTPSKEKPPAEEAPILKRETVVGGLPCFKCHDLKAFLEKDEKGIFSHKRHSLFDVHCNQCHDVRGHTPPKIISQTCETCHSLKPFTYEAAGLPVRFDHKNHTKTLSCSDCHTKLFDMRKGSRKMTMDDLYKGKYCGSCHNGTKAFPSEKCERCHSMKAFKKPLAYEGGGMGKVVFSHEFHTAAFPCAECHAKQFPMKKSAGKMKMDDMYAGKLCGSCHNGQMAFSAQECMRCHKQQ